MNWWIGEQCWFTGKQVVVWTVFGRGDKALLSPWWAEGFTEWSFVLTLGHSVAGVRNDFTNTFRMGKNVVRACTLALGPEYILSQIGGNSGKIPSVFIFLIICCEMCSFSSHERDLWHKFSCQCGVHKIENWQSWRKGAQSQDKCGTLYRQRGWDFLRYSNGMARTASPGPCACPLPGFTPSP